MNVVPDSQGLLLYKEKQCIGRCRFVCGGERIAVTGLTVDPAWRRKGYGTYLAKAMLKATGGFDTARPTLYTLPLPGDEGEAAFWRKMGFRPEGGQLVRRRVPEYSAVRLVHDTVLPRLATARLVVDATCGNGGDTEFLARHAGPECTVLAMDIQQQALDNTAARLRALAPVCRWQTVPDSHENLLRYAPPGTADLVLFNFGWLPGADHAVHSTAAGSVPALRAALEALRPGGLLSAVLYSGRVIGDSEKQASLDFFRSLPLTEYTVLECRFANWADTAPLPVFVLKKQV